jgi:hypothetical protein
MRVHACIRADCGDISSGERSTRAEAGLNFRKRFSRGQSEKRAKLSHSSAPQIV